MARILLAEDDTSLCRLLEKGLVNQGHAVVAVNDGWSALEKVQNQEFDLLLTDVVMPLLDGIELTRRALRLRPALKVILITGFAVIAYQNKALLPGTPQIVSKPFHLNDILRNVDAVLAGEVPSAGEEEADDDGRRGEVAPLR